jgi:O-antigen/teichoic acid export membrane protein
LPRRWKKIVPRDTLSGLQFFQLFRYGSAFLISIILPRAGILPGDIGIFESFLFFAGVISYFWITGLIQALLPLASQQNPLASRITPPESRSSSTHPNPSLKSGRGLRIIHPASRVTRHASREFFNSAVLLLLFSVLASLALWLGSPALGSLVGQELPREIVGLVILYLVLFAPSSLVEYGYVLAGETKKLVRYGIIAFSLQILFVGIPVIVGLGVKGAMWGMIAAGGFRTIWLIIMLIRNGDFHISLPFWKRYLALGGPIMVSVLLSGSALYINGFIISARFDPATFAIFRYGARELPIVALLAYALSNAMVPIIARDGTENGLRILKERSGRMASWMFPLTVAVVLVAYFLFPLVYGKNFTDSAGVFNLYLLLITSRLLFPQTILLAAQKTNIQMLAALLELILNISLSLILVQVWGIRGVALATVIAYYFERIFLMAYTRIALGIPVKQYVEVKRHLLWTGILLLAFLFAELVIAPMMLS